MYSNPTGEQYGSSVVLGRNFSTYCWQMNSAYFFAHRPNIVAQDHREILFREEVRSRKLENREKTIMSKDKMKFSVSLDFESISLPPFKDILILGKKCNQGKIGVSRCLDLLAPDNFQLVELDDETVEAIFVNKKILNRMPKGKVIEILKEQVFPYITKEEIIKVDFTVRISK